MRVEARPEHSRVVRCVTVRSASTEGVREAVAEILRGAVAGAGLPVKWAAHPAVEREGEAHPEGARQEEARQVKEGWKALLDRRTARVDCAVAGAKHEA